MGAGSIAALGLLSLVVGIFWGWLVSVLRRRGVIPDDGSVIRLPCPWERGGHACWLEWILLNELKGTIFVMLAVSVNTGWPPMLLMVFLLILEAIKYSEKVQRSVVEPLRAAGYDTGEPVLPLPVTKRIANPPRLPGILRDRRPRS